MTTAAVFTLGKDESFHLPQWISYYSQHFDPSDMYVLDHDSQHPVVRATLANFDGNVRPVENEVVFDHDWLLSVVHGMQRELLDRYDYVIYTDTDELIIPGSGTLREFLENASEPGYRCTGYEVLEDRVYRNAMFDKTLIANHPLAWVYGYHHSNPQYAQSDDLFLYHLHKLNFAESWAKTQRWNQHRWDATALAGGWSIQNQITDEEAYRLWFYSTDGVVLESLHPRIAVELDKLRELD